MATYDLTSLSVIKDPAHTMRKGGGRTPWSKRIARKTTLFLCLTAEQILTGNAVGPEGTGIRDTGARGHEALGGSRGGSGDRAGVSRP
jgi:hypothetical protein